jgi:hypothetical protein
MKMLIIWFTKIAERNPWFFGNNGVIDAGFSKKVKRRGALKFRSDHGRCKQRGMHPWEIQVFGRAIVP